MEIVYRFLGVVARFNERCSKFSLHFLPFNIILILIIGFCECLLYWNLPGTAPSRTIPSLDLPETLALMLAVAAFEVAMVVTMWSRYIVFRTIDKSERYTWHLQEVGYESPSNSVVIEPLSIAVRGTGLFTCVDGSAQRFLEMPAVVKGTGKDIPSINSTIVIPKTFLGFTTGRRTGLWSVDLSYEGARNLSRGILYLGFRRRPAIRFDYTPVGRTRVQTVVLTFDNESDREVVTKELLRKVAVA